MNDDEALLEAIHQCAPTLYRRAFHVVDARSFLAAGTNAVFKGMCVSVCVCVVMVLVLL